MYKICIICGKEAAIENFCTDCFLNQKDLFYINNFDLKICQCNSYFSERDWKHFENLDETVKKIVEDNIKTEYKIIKKLIKLKKIGNKYHVEIICRGYIYPCKKIKGERKNIVVKIKTVKCDRCKKLSGGYYESVLQLRTKKDFLEKTKFLDHYRNSISNIEKIKEGYDIFLLEKGVAKKIANEFKLLGLKIKITNKLFGVRKGKRIYRVYYSIKD